MSKNLPESPRPQAEREPWRSTKGTKRPFGSIVDHYILVGTYFDIKMSAAEYVQVRSGGGRRDLDADVAVADVGEEVLVLAGARGGRVVAGVRLQRVQGVRVGVELVAHARLPRVVVGGEGRGRRAAGIKNYSL